MWCLEGCWQAANYECCQPRSWLQGFLALFSGDTGEIRSEVREQIDAKVRCVVLCWLGLLCCTCSRKCL